jgi:hypothetical protein
MSILESEDNIKLVHDITESSSGEQQPINKESEKFLESLREQCKKHKSISFVCNSLRVVLPVTPVQFTPPPAASRETAEVTDANRQSLLENTKLHKRFTKSSGSMDTETHIPQSEQYDETTVPSMVNHYNFYHTHKQGSVVTDREKVYDSLARQPFKLSGPNPTQLDMDDSNYNKPDMFHNMDHLNHDNSKDTVFRMIDKSEENPYSESTEENIEYKSNTPDILRNTEYQHEVITNSSEENTPIETDRNEQTAYSEFMETNAYTDTDYDEVEKGVENTSFEMEEDDSKKYAAEHKNNLDCNDNNNCSTGNNRPENIGEIAEKSNDMLDGLTDDSLKIFKNSFTIKFPTFERITNKITEWLKSVFGTKSRDEGKILCYRSLCLKSY